MFILLMFKYRAIRKKGNKNLLMIGFGKKIAK